MLVATSKSSDAFSRAFCLLRTSAHCGMPIFLKVNHQLESRMPEIGPSGSEGGAKISFAPTPIDGISTWIAVYSFSPVPVGRPFQGGFRWSFPRPEGLGCSVKPLRGSLVYKDQGLGWTNICNRFAAKYDG